MRSRFPTLAVTALLALLLLPGAIEARTRRPAPTVTAALQALERTAQIAPAEYNRYATAYAAARRSARHLSGTRLRELTAVLTNVQAMAAANLLIPSRLPALFLTLERNREWWTTKYLPPANARVSFPGSRLVWEYYPGQGIEIQWLGTFGAANGYYLAGNENTELRELLNEAIPLATHRAGGIAWEYMFQFDGGLPPWTSGLSQGTALQAFARGWSRLHEPAYLTAAQEALGIFQHAPPEGVRVTTAAGAEYAEYTFAPSDRILNGFIQAVIGLNDYATITKDPLGVQLFEAGDAEARLEVPHYDTGAWSLYDQHEESNLNYHELLAEFLEHLCQRTQATIPPDAIYCTTAEHFQADLHDPPTLELLSTTLRGGTRAGVRIELSKIATVSLTIRQNGRTVWSNRATLAGGRPRLLWVTPSRGGLYEAILSAVDLAGNRESTTGTIAVSAAKH